jgi:tetratricopeptide (TPR) repeat protein
MEATVWSFDTMVRARSWVGLVVLVLVVSPAAVAQLGPDTTGSLAPSGEPSHANETADQASSSEGAGSASEAAGAGASGSGSGQPHVPSSEVAASLWNTLATEAWLVIGAIGTIGVGLGVRRARTDRCGDEAAPTLEALAGTEEGRCALDHPGPLGAMLLGQRALADGQPRKAEHWFAAAVELDEELSIAHLCRGLCRFELAEPAAAAEALETACELDPSSGLATYHLARAHAMQGNVDEAAAAIAPLIEADPSMAEVIADEPAFDALRDDPRWLAALGRLDAGPPSSGPGRDR